MTTITDAQRGSTFARLSELEVTVCTCGVLFALPQRMLEQRREDGKSFYCPHGHSLVFNQGKTKAELLKDSLEWERDRAARLAAERDQLQASLRGTRARAARTTKDLKRVRERAHAALCPVAGCGRSFVQLRRHLASKHPDYVHEGETA